MSSTLFLRVKLVTRLTRSLPWRRRSELMNKKDIVVRKNELSHLHWLLVSDTPDRVVKVILVLLEEEVHRTTTFVLIYVSIYTRPVPAFASEV
jgi:hypothetical protein